MQYRLQATQSVHIGSAVGGGGPVDRIAHAGNRTAHPSRRPLTLTGSARIFVTSPSLPVVFGFANRQESVISLVLTAQNADIFEIDSEIDFLPNQTAGA